MESLKRLAEKALSIVVDTPWGLLIVFFALYLIVGTMEFNEQRTDDCARRGQVWEQSTDTCRKAEGGAK
jgi:hypothetical protein